MILLLCKLATIIHLKLDKKINPFKVYFLKKKLYMPELNYFALVLFIISVSFTPGPNNFLLLSSGIKFGLRRTLKHIMGILVGFPLMLIILGILFHYISSINPTLFYIFSYIGIVYLLYLAYKIILSDNSIKEDPNHQPITFMQAVLFQWVNPKAWIMILSVLSTFITSHDQYFEKLLIITTLFILLGTINCFMWATLGTFIKKRLSHKQHVRYINALLGFMLFLAVLQMVPTKLALP